MADIIFCTQCNGSHKSLLSIAYAGEPTKEEKLILALGLGSRGQNIDHTSCSGKRAVVNPNLFFNITPAGYTGLDLGLLCRRKRPAANNICEPTQVCPAINGM